MKHPFFISLMLFLIPFVLLSQNLDKLDKVNGFRKFKLGGNFSSFTNLKVQPTNIKLNGVTHYIYTGNGMTDFYGVPIEQISLTFYKNKLFQINVSFGTIFKEYRYEQFSLVQTNLEANFGSDYHKISTSPQAEILNGNIWDSRTVRLESLRINLDERDGSRNPRFNYIQGYILFTQKKIQQEQQSSELE